MQKRVWQTGPIEGRLQPGDTAAQFAEQIGCGEHTGEHPGDLPQATGLSVQPCCGHSVQTTVHCGAHVACGGQVAPCVGQGARGVGQKIVQSIPQVKTLQTADTI